MLHNFVFSKSVLMHPDGGGIRGYWSLLVLSALMEAIAIIERNHDGEFIVESSAPHSFYPEEPQQSPRSDQSDGDGEAENNAGSPIPPNGNGYLPCHYFDLICGSSTGA